MAETSARLLDILLGSGSRLRAAGDPVALAHALVGCCVPALGSAAAVDLEDGTGRWVRGAASPDVPGPQAEADMPGVIAAVGEVRIWHAPDRAGPVPSGPGPGLPIGGPPGVVLAIPLGQAPARGVLWLHRPGPPPGRRLMVLLQELGARAGDRLAALSLRQRMHHGEVRGRARIGELAALMQAIPAAVWITSEDGRLWMNDAAAHMLGVGEAGRTITTTAALRDWVHIHADGRELRPEELPTRRVVRENRPMRDVELDLVRRDGGVRRILGSADPLHDADGRVYGAISAFVDVTDRRAAERALRESERLLHEVADTVPAIVWKADAEGRVQWGNGRWHDWTGEPATRVVGAHWIDFVHADDAAAVQQAWSRARDTGGPLEAEFRMRWRDGGARWVLTRAIPARSADGAPEAWYGTTLDIEERRIAEAQIDGARQAAEQADHAKSQFLAAASHDLRQPFQAMRLLLHLLMERLDRPQQREIAHRLSTAMTSGEELLSTLLDVSAFDAGTVTPNLTSLELTPLLARLVREMEPQAAAKGLRIRLRARAGAVETDPLLFERLLRNVLSNALKYTETGGILVASRRRGDRLRVEVWDTGRGIPADKLDSVFEEFVQVGNPARDRTRGLGLGLAIVRRAARVLGHAVALHSRPGRGSVFLIDLPLARSEVRTMPPARNPMGVSLSGTVLLVEDDALQRLAMEQILGGWGLATVSASCLEEAVARAAGRRPALVITDLRLPGGGDGFDVIDRVRDVVGGAIPALILTGETAVDRMRQVAERGIRFLHKPYNPRQLRQALDEMLKGHPAGR